MDIKTQEDRAVDLKSIFKAVESGSVVDVNVPVDVKELFNKIKGVSVSKLINDSVMIKELKAVKTEKGKDLFKLYDTGWTAETLSTSGNRKLRMKLQLFLE